MELNKVTKPKREQEEFAELKTTELHPGRLHDLGPLKTTAGQLQVSLLLSSCLLQISNPVPAADSTIGRKGVPNSCATVRGSHHVVAFLLQRGD